MPEPRSVKIDQDERGGWSSDRPRRGGPGRPADISVRCRVLAPTDRLRYMPGSLVVVVCGSHELRDRFAERVVEDRGAVVSLDRVRALLAGRVPEGEISARAWELLEAAVRKRLEAGHSVVLLTAGASAGERESFLRMAAAARRPRHLILVEAPRDAVPEAERQVLNELRRALDRGEVGAEGFHTALRIGGPSVGELKRIVFRPPPEED
jgi:predicted kinase